ncbi:hypothetical protein AHAS_Ahas07G0129800 [Arachis hypogaea]
MRLCSYCANSSSSFSSSSSSFHCFSVTSDASTPSLRHSRFMAIPFLRSRSRFSGADSNLDGARDSPTINGSRSVRSFWSLFRLHKNYMEHESEATTA